MKVIFYGNVKVPTTKKKICSYFVSVNKASNDNNVRTCKNPIRMLRVVERERQREKTKRMETKR